MIELRYKVEECTEIMEFGEDITHRLRPVLQIKYMLNPEELGIQEPMWGEWQDVPTEYVEV